jgi:hypothetical protein
MSGLVYRSAHGKFEESIADSSREDREIDPLIRDQKVLLDADLADLYGVETRTLVQAVKRNIERFPGDFMFQLTEEEFAILRSQSVISRSWGGRRTAPYVFTEQGVAMLSSVLRSPRAPPLDPAHLGVEIPLKLILQQQDFHEVAPAQLS